MMFRKLLKLTKTREEIEPKLSLKYDEWWGDECQTSVNTTNLYKILFFLLIKAAMD